MVFFILDVSNNYRMCHSHPYRWLWNPPCGRLSETKQSSSCSMIVRKLVNLCPCVVLQWYEVRHLFFNSSFLKQIYGFFKFNFLWQCFLLGNGCTTLGAVKCCLSVNHKEVPSLVVISWPVSFVQRYETLNTTSCRCTATNIKQTQQNTLLNCLEMKAFHTTMVTR